MVSGNYRNTKIALINLLQSLEIYISEDTIEAELDKHPDAGSLLAIADVLNAFNVKNVAYAVDKNEITDTPCPFIAYSALNGGSFSVVHEINDKHVKISSEESSKSTVTTKHFREIFSGTILLPEPGSNAAATQPILSRIAHILRTPVIGVGFALLLILSMLNLGYFDQLTWQTGLISVFKLSGLFISVVLLIQSVDADNILVNKLCTTTGKIDCSSILSSKAARIFNLVSWSEVGFFYFAGTLLILLLQPHSLVVKQMLAILTILALPYTFYSIYYQAKVAKHWCLLCCAVQLLIWLELIPLAGSLYLTYNSPTAAEASQIIIGVVFPVVLWMSIKPALLRLQQIGPIKDQLRHFKYNTEYFNTMLSAQPKHILPEQEWSIVLGNPNADHVIVMVTNPYCAPCARMHQVLHNLLEQQPFLQARIVFTSSNSDADSTSSVSRHFMMLNALPDKNVIANALSDWYAQPQKDYSIWSKKYPIPLQEAEYMKLEKHKQWCSNAAIASTPTILIDEYKLPELYHLTDLKYMLL